MLNKLDLIGDLVESVVPFNNIFSIRNDVFTFNSVKIYIALKNCPSLKKLLYKTFFWHGFFRNLCDL